MMKRIILLAVAAILSAAALKAESDFDRYFDGRTLRLDYILAGNDSTTAIYFEEAGVTPGWAGRRHNLDNTFVRGNGTITVADHESGETIYTNSFSTLFQEWQHTAEAAKVAKAFESTFLVPFPRKAVDVTVSLYDNRNNMVATMTHPIDPTDILIRSIPPTTAESRYMHKAGSEEECVDLVIIAEGYTAASVDKFFADAQRASDAILSHEPFASMADRFNILAVATLAGDEGPDVPREGIWNRTAHRSHYDTFYSDRYLTTQALHGIYDGIAGLPAEHIILLVNTPLYGGGGILNQITVASADHPTFKQVLVHEFGHAYGGLADEYFYNDNSDTTYPLDVEPWEPNITTLVDFNSKWADMVPKNTPIPTPWEAKPEVGDLNPADKKDAKLIESITHDVGVYEGAGYCIHGIYRPVKECRMRTNDVEVFCPVCSRTIVGITDWYTGKK